MLKPRFVKSSYSTVTGECVEVARDIPCVVAVRDSKSLDGPIVRFSPTAWAAFTTARALDSSR